MKHWWIGQPDRALLVVALTGATVAACFDRPGPRMPLWIIVLVGLLYPTLATVADIDHWRWRRRDPTARIARSQDD